MNWNMAISANFLHLAHQGQKSLTPPWTEMFALWTSLFLTIKKDHPNYFCAKFLKVEEN